MSAASVAVVTLWRRLVIVRQKLEWMFDDDSDVASNVVLELMFAAGDVASDVVWHRIFDAGDVTVHHMTFDAGNVSGDIVMCLMLELMSDAGVYFGILLLWLVIVWRRLVILWRKLEWMFDDNGDATGDVVSQRISDAGDVMMHRMTFDAGDAAVDIVMCLMLELMSDAGVSFGILLLWLVIVWRRLVILWQKLEWMFDVASDVVWHRICDAGPVVSQRIFDACHVMVCDLTFDAGDVAGVVLCLWRERRSQVADAIDKIKISIFSNSHLK